MLVATWVVVRWRERRRILGALRIRNAALCELREGQVVLSATYHDGWLELEDHRRTELDGPVHIDAAGGWTLRADPKIDPLITLVATRPAIRPRLPLR